MGVDPPEAGDQTVQDLSSVFVAGAGKQEQILGGAEAGIGIPLTETGMDDLPYAAHADADLPGCEGFSTGVQH